MKNEDRILELLAETLQRMDRYSERFDRWQEEIKQQRDEMKLQQEAIKTQQEAMQLQLDVNFALRQKFNSTMTALTGMRMVSTR